ncbi:efflux RND transporter permease subunit [Vibrio sp. SCSIO 43136]|uniref:efflux RND transporter permease subunit n=1 Tax=Vibrio sp. SCSIO 43136 TaxID=2819101 RepID=UPI00207549C2|nr:efflux RND transporter permease subunit [Vibrio sp. SCSIO 43136]USD67554.1 efflux RND transporter permease subunit [Vibrio sp. SCSIO 43136]
MTSFIRYFAQRSFLARIMTIMVLLLGAASLSSLKLQEYPNVAFESADIVTHYPGATAQDIEINITNKIEKEIKNIEGVNYFSSQSVDGTSTIEVEFLPDADHAKIMRDLQQAIDRINDLPTNLKNPPTLTQRATSSFEVMTFGVNLADDNQDIGQLQQYGYLLEKKLRNINGVSQVSINGYNEREFQINIDPELVSRYQLSFDDISQAIQNHSISQSGGSIESWIGEQKIVTMTQVKSADDISNIVIKALPSGAIVRVGDVAKVEDTFVKATEVGMVNGATSLIFSVTNSGSADIIATVEQVQQLLAQEQSNWQGVFEYQINVNLADDMANKFSIVATNGGIGLILVLAVLSLILKRQVAFWVSVSIPFCILGVMVVLPMVGQNLDSITLAALLLVIGIIVDDSVIIAESIYQQKEQGKPALQAAIDGTKDVFKPILASLTTTALVFIPIAFIPGTMGNVAAVIPVTVIAALLFSLAECTFTLPAHLAHSLEKQTLRQTESSRWNRVSQGYQALLEWCLRFRKTVLLIAILALSGSAFLTTTLKVDIFPSDAAKYIEVYTETETGTPLSEIRNAHLAMETAIASLPTSELKSFQMVYGTPTSQGTIVLSNFDQRERTAQQIIADLNSQLTLNDNALFVKFSVDAGGPPPGEPVEIRVLGGTQTSRDQAVATVSQWLTEHSGLDNVSNSEALRDKQLSILPQYHWLAKYGLTVADLTTTLRIAFEGDTVTSTWIGDQNVDLRVILDQKYRQLDQLAKLKVYTAQGTQVPLAQLAKVEEIESPQLIKHYNGAREVTVTAQISDPDLTAVEISDAMAQHLEGKIPAGVEIEFGGEAESTNETMSGFMVAFPAAMVGIYFVLAVMFNSLLQPVLIMAVIPFAVVISLMALVLHMQALSMFALIGILGMTGVVVNNSLVLINQINQRRAQVQDATQAIVEASVSRLRPILLTSLTTVAGLLPLAYGLGGTDVYMGPMSLTLGYGLLFSMPVVLLVVPALYAVCFARQKSEKH